MSDIKATIYLSFVLFVLTIALMDPIQHSSILKGHLHGRSATQNRKQKRTRQRQLVLLSWQPWMRRYRQDWLSLNYVAQKALWQIWPIASWPIVQLANYIVGELSSRSSVKLAYCLVGQLSSWSIVLLVNCQVG